MKTTNTEKNTNLTNKTGTQTTASGKYKLVCGMEIHAELKTKSKMFCGCKNDPFGADKPNIHTCPVCLGMPGGLPVANKKAIEWTIKVGLALGCKINLFSKFDRKNYFYPDIPKAYQISQYDIPFCYDGVVETSYGPVKITRIHLEEDTGKLQHVVVDGKKVSLIDFNRSSVPLMELVSEPDIKSPEQAKEFAKKVRDVLRFLEVADCDMDKGGMRLEANTSLATLDQKIEEGDLPNYKVEVKNINSFRFAEKAIEYEMERQAEILDNGKVPTQETRGWDANKNITFSQRTKEDAEDYRYFPDPDLPPIRFTQEKVDEIKDRIPELPEAKIKRWSSEYGVEKKYSSWLITSLESSIWTEEIFKLAITKKIKPNKVANSIVNKKIKVTLDDAPQTVIEKFNKLFAVDEVSNEEIITAINEVMDGNQKAVDSFKAGETKVVGFFIGQTLRKLGKKVDSGRLSGLLIKELGK